MFLKVSILPDIHTFIIYPSMGQGGGTHRGAWPEYRWAEGSLVGQAGREGLWQGPWSGSGNGAGPESHPPDLGLEEPWLWGQLHASSWELVPHVSCRYPSLLWQRRHFPFKGGQMKRRWHAPPEQQGCWPPWHHLRYPRGCQASAQAPAQEALCVANGLQGG